MTTSSLRAEASRLITLGFAVFPLYERDTDGGCGCADPGCRNAAKHPATKRGLLDASRDQKAIDRWWRSRPWNIGVATGAPAIVLDIDPRHGGEETLAALEGEHGPMPVTWRAFTGGGGEHIYLAPPLGRAVPNSASKLGPGLDVRGHGGYVVAPSSVHACGREYVWNVDGHPEEVSLALMPTWMVDSCSRPNGAVARFDPSTFSGGPVPEGGRNSKLTSLTGHLLRRFVDPRLVLELVTAFNDARCCPPLAPDEVLKIVESIAGRELLRRKAAS